MASFVVDSHNPRCPQHLVYWRQPLSSNARLCCGDRLPPTYVATSTALGRGPKHPASGRALLSGHAEPPQRMWAPWWLEVAGDYSFRAGWTCGRREREMPRQAGSKIKSKREAKLWLFRSINVNNKLYINNPGWKRRSLQYHQYLIQGRPLRMRKNPILESSAASRMNQ